MTPLENSREVVGQWVGKKGNQLEWINELKGSLCVRFTWSQKDLKGATVLICFTLGATSLRLGSFLYFLYYLSKDDVRPMDMLEKLFFSGQSCRGKWDRGPAWLKLHRSHSHLGAPSVSSTGHPPSSHRLTLYFWPRVLWLGLQGFPLAGQSPATCPWPSSSHRCSDSRKSLNRTARKTGCSVAYNVSRYLEPCASGLLCFKILQGLRHIVSVIKSFLF